MKVILLEDVKGVGKKGDLLNASDGHAINYLLPKKLAVEATTGNLNELQQKQRSMENKKAKELEQAQEQARKLEGQKIVIAVKIGENGKLFGSVTNKEIGAALTEQIGVQIDRKKIVLVDAIKTVGEKCVDVKLHPQVTARVTVEIVNS